VNRWVRWTCALCTATILLHGASTAHGAEPSPPSDPMKQLAELLAFEPAPTSRDEFLEMGRERLPRIEAFAEQHMAHPAGAAALLFIIELTLAINEPDRGIGAADRFLHRYPNHENLAQAKFMAAMLQRKARHYAAAQEAFEAYVEEYPEDAEQLDVQTMLDALRTIGTEAPAFETTDLTGATVKLSDFRGKVLVVDFFAGWCPPCDKQTPRLIDLYHQYHTAGLAVVGVSVDRTVDDARAYTARRAIPWTVTFQEPGLWKNPVAVAFGVSEIPSLWVIDSQGRILHRDLSVGELADVLAELFDAVDEAEPEPEPTEPPSP